MNIQTEHIADYFIAVLDEESLPQGDPWYADLYGIDTWCHDTFGPQDLWGETPITGWKRMRNKVFFTAEAMLTMFILRWGGADELASS